MKTVCDWYQNMAARITALLKLARRQYSSGAFKEAQVTCDQIYQSDAHRLDNLLLLGAVHFQMRNFSECIFYNQQAIRIDPAFAEAYGNLGNSLKELGDIVGAIQFYLKAIKLKPRFCDAYNNLASAYMQLGQTKQAIETYQMALVLNPSLVDAHSNMGNLFKAQGRLVEAKRCYLEAIRIRPDFAIAWSNLAGVFKDEGDLDTSVAYYQEAIRLSPEFADAYSNLGNAFKEAGRREEAVRAYNEAIRLRPDFAIAHGNLASVYYDEGKMDNAVRTYKHAIQLEPNFPDAYSNLGNALREVSRLEEAINQYRTALRLKPDHPHAYNNLGNALKDKGMVKEAIHCYMTACRLMPRFAAAHSNLGSILKEQGKADQAIAHYHEAISIDPMFADAYSNMGNAYKDMGKLDEAIRCYTTAIRLKPHFADAYGNLAAAYLDGGRIDDAIACYRKALSLKPNFPDAFANMVYALASVCDWRQRDGDLVKLNKLLGAQLAVENSVPSVQPFHALAFPLPMATLRAISSRFARRVRMNVALLEMPAFRFRAKKPQQRMRVGYVSSDFGNHPLSHLLQSTFGFHDLTRFEVFVYALNPDDGSSWRHKIKREAEHFKDLSGIMHADAARVIHADGIHILVNLNGYTKGARNEIFSLRPAPIQMSLMGFPGTVGADSIQYLVADERVVPEALQEFYREKMLYMPNSYFCTDHKQSARDVLDPDKCPLREQYNIPEDKFVFCCFNQMYKLDPGTFDVWMRVLKRVPNSILWLLRFPPLCENNIRAEAKSRGVRENRIFFTDVAPKAEHLKRCYLADLFLDTPQCNGHTTSCDVLWSGTPIVTMPGESMASRAGLSFMEAVGLKELVTFSLEEYEEVAVALALDMDKLWDVRKRLEESRLSSPLFDTRRWVHDLERGYLAVWERHERGLPVAHIHLS